MILKPYIVIDAAKGKILLGKDTEAEARAHAKQMSMSGGNSYIVSKLISMHSAERIVNDKTF